MNLLMNRGKQRISLMGVVVNPMTVSRILLALLLLKMETLLLGFYLVFAVCGITDILDGFLARKTNTVSELGSILDSIADLVFAAVCMVKLIPVITVQPWMWVWITIIAIIKLSNYLYGIVVNKKLRMYHSKANRLTGFLLFLLVFAAGLFDVSMAAVPVCSLASFAAVQEGMYIIADREMK